MNPASRLKLQSLAKRLKLPQALFDEALDRLQSSPAATRLSHYEKAFVKFLNSEFEKLAGDVLSLGIEKQAIDLANRKYQINNARAEQLIHAQAEAAGISRISPAEAAVFAEQTIIDQVGEQTVLDDETHLKLHKIGRKWGLDTAEIDRLISRRLASNRKQHSRSREKVAVLMLILAIILGGLAGAYGMGLFAKKVPDTVDRHPEPSPETEATAKTVIPREALNELVALSQSDTQWKASVEKILSDDVLRRGQAYQELVRASCEIDSPHQQEFITVLSRLFFEEPDDDTALQIIDSIHDLLTPIPAGETMLRRDLENDYRANRLLGGLFFSRPKTDRADTSVRILALKECLASDIGIPLGDVESLDQYLPIAENAIATEQWNRIIQSSWSSPSNAALIFESLYRLTQSRLSQNSLDEYRDELLLSIMKSDRSRWREFRSQISGSIESADDIRLAEWMAIYASAADEALRDLLGDLILKRINVQPQPRGRKDIAEAIQKRATEYRNRVLNPMIDRSEWVDKHFSRIMNLDNSASILPDRIAQMALAVNVEFAFCSALENATHIDDSSFLEFDRLSAEPEPRLRELISLPIDRRGSKSTGPATATASDKRQKNVAMERLSDSGPDSSGFRILALKQLERVAPRFGRISYPEAEILADYFLAEHDLKELLEIESRIESFSHWPNLALAIADKLPQNKVAMDQALTVTRLLLGREFEINQDSDWQDKLRLDMLVAIAADIQNQIDQDPDNIKSNWIRLELYLTDLYRQRQAIALDQNVSRNDAASPFQATIDLLDGLAQRNPSQASSRGLQQATSLVRTSPLNEIEKAVFANQLLIQLLATELAGTGLAVDVELIVLTLRAEFQSTKLPGEHLYATEQALFKLMDLKRKSLVNALLKQN